jgi:ribosomal protein S18 acetylase RimI-like enzyme
MQHVVLDWNDIESDRKTISKRIDFFLGKPNVCSSGTLFVGKFYGVIANVKTIEAMRRKGWGTKLIKAIESRAKSYSLRAVTLRVEKNTFMQKWYIKLGYSFYADDAENKKYEWLVKQFCYESK